MAIERIVPGTKEWEAYYANHIVRYQFAARVLKSKNVNCLLDAACGVGYGSKYLAGELANASITSVDRSIEALATANAVFSSSSIRFIADDCHTLAAAAQYAPFDAVVSFETLEHLPKPGDFLNRCFENLAAGGKIIVSTPNRSVSSPEVLNWEFHEKEYTAAEFYGLLQSAGFKKIQLYGQQFNLKGKIKNEVRNDLYSLWSNPLVRLGRWIQSRLRGHDFAPLLKETTDDFEMVSFQQPAEVDDLGLEGPFVLIAVAEK